ncbi:hypothetical protein IAR50_001684 [Cryptococcus sp. DSM 104548]
MSFTFDSIFNDTYADNTVEQSSSYYQDLLSLIPDLPAPFAPSYNIFTSSGDVPPGTVCPSQVFTAPPEPHLFSFVERRVEFGRSPTTDRHRNLQEVWVPNGFRKRLLGDMKTLVGDIVERQLSKERVESWREDTEI